MNNNAPLLDVGGKVAMGNYAGIPGTGPAGTVCSGCGRLEPDRSRFRCGHFQVLTGRKGKHISPAAASCRYFEQRRAFNQTAVTEG
jgi:hypothetical protein